MFYYEVWVASAHYRGDRPLTYRFDQELAPLSIVSVPLRNETSTGFVSKQVPKPDFTVKEVKALISAQPLPGHCFELAKWLSEYYCVSIGEALRQFAPTKTLVRRQIDEIAPEQIQEDLRLDFELTGEQANAIKFIEQNKSTTVLLHGDTGSGKTRVYLELAQAQIDQGNSAIILTPEIGLTTQLSKAVKDKLNCSVYLLHSEMTPATRKKVWFEILESHKPIVVIGPRSALFAPVSKIGLIVVDEAHETAYKQEQAPRYNAVRAASRLGAITKARVILGSATPLATDYYLAKSKNALVRMRLQAKNEELADIGVEIVDLRDKNNSSENRYLSNVLTKHINETLSDHKQAMIYYNRRGTSRLILCSNCGWQLNCPNCDIPLIYHGDDHEARCHTCGHKEPPPSACPVCDNHEIIYTSIGTKALASLVDRLFTSAKVRRFDSDNAKGERLNELYDEVRSGGADLLVGTQLIAKGLDLPKLSLVGIISAEASLAMPDYTAEERTFQLLYQVIGRVGRHSAGKIVIQTYQPDSYLIKYAAARDYESFYSKILEERRTYGFPPFNYLMKLTCRRTSDQTAKKAANSLKNFLEKTNSAIEVIGPAPSFYHKRGRNFYYQLVVRSKNRGELVKLAKTVPAGWTIDLDPVDLL